MFEDYKTRKDRLTKTKRKFVKVVFPAEIYEAFKAKCDSKGYHYSERLLMLITKDLTK